MADPLDIAVQRKRIEALQRTGRSTEEAEARLRAMLDAVSWRFQAGPDRQMNRASPDVGHDKGARA